MDLSVGFNDLTGIPADDAASVDRRSQLSNFSKSLNAGSLAWSTTKRWDDTDHLMCVLVLSRGGRVLVNYWPNRSRSRQLKFDTPAVARVLLGYQMMLCYPPLSKMAIDSKLGAVVANGGYCTCVLIGEQRDAVLVSKKIAGAATHLCSLFETSHASRLQMLKIQEDLEAESDRQMNTEAIMAEGAATAKDPLQPATQEYYKEFDNAILHALNDKSTTLRGIVASIPKTPNILLSGVYDFVTGRVLDCVTSERLPWPLDADPASIVRKAFETRDPPLHLRMWYDLRGLYNKGNGVVWKMVHDAWVEGGDDIETEGGAKFMSLRLEDDDGTELEVHSCMDTVAEDGELRQVVAFCVGSQAALLPSDITIPDNPTAFASKFLLKFPLRRVTEGDPTTSQTGSVAEEAFLAAATLIATLPARSQAVPMPRPPRSVVSSATVPPIRSLHAHRAASAAPGPPGPAVNPLAVPPR
eukprot:TRINITY_DN32599_c0_g1_i1.p1 TRINITY_DN32599_c0_g1~~TRINITY_DN32599_c0_g1_i1.p1  ORF type:complete len:469 (+),score=189.72 TRINITY_DN32599_c0_g1_i1:87-1493(+)